MKKRIIEISIFFSLVIFCNSTDAQEIFSENNNKPIEIFADQGIEWHKNKKKYIASGNAKAKKGNSIITSDTLEAIYKDDKDSDNKITLIKAIGNVTIKNESNIISGGHLATYNIEKEYFVVNGNKLRVDTDSDKLTANSQIEYWKIKNIAIATGNAQVKKGKEYTINADRLVWHLKEFTQEKEKRYKVKKMMAFENVVIETNSEIAYSDKALYNKIDEKCKLFGNVRLRKSENYVTGDYAELDLITGVSKLMPYPKKDKLKKNRVKAILRSNE